MVTSERATRERGKPTLNLDALVAKTVVETAAAGGSCRNAGGRSCGGGIDATSRAAVWNTDDEEAKKKTSWVSGANPRRSVEETNSSPSLNV